MRLRYFRDRFVHTPMCSWQPAYSVLIREVVTFHKVVPLVQHQQHNVGSMMLITRDQLRINHLGNVVHSESILLVTVYTYRNHYLLLLLELILCYILQESCTESIRDMFMSHAYTYIRVMGEANSAICSLFACITL